MVLTILVLRYKIEIKEESQFEKETFEERKARVLASRPGLTMTCVFSFRWRGAIQVSSYRRFLVRYAFRWCSSDDRSVLMEYTLILIFWTTQLNL